jgi:hypothetical protein
VLQERRPDAAQVRLVVQVEDHDRTGAVLRAAYRSR